MISSLLGVGTRNEERNITNLTGGDKITRNQIEYYKLLETRRANQAQERLTQIRDFNANRLGLATLDETSRSHRASEAISTEANRLQSIDVQTRQLSQQETARSNLAREQLTREQNIEARRSNLAREALTAQANAETYRSNRASERIRSEQNLLTKQANEEARRSNLSRESIQRQQTQISAYQAETGRLSLAETQRSNLVREAETERSNRAREYEQHNYNVANVVLGYHNLNENIRYHSGTLSNQAAQIRAQQQYQQQQIALGRQNANISAYNAYTSRLAHGETQRSNTTNQALRQRELNQQQRYQQRSLDIAQQKNRLQQQYNRQNLIETERHNRAEESNKRIVGTSQAVRNYVGSVSDIFKGAATLIPLLI